MDPESLADNDDDKAATAAEVEGETAAKESDAKHAEGVPATEFITSAGLAGLVAGGARGNKDPKLPEFYDGEGVDHTSHIARSNTPEGDTETPDEEPYLVHDDRPEVADYERGYDESDLPEFPFYTDRKWRIWGGIAGILAAAGAGIMTWWAVDYFSNDSADTDGGDNTPVTQTIAPPPQDGEGAVDSDDLREQLVTDTETPEEDKDKDKDKSKERATVTETVDAPPREEDRDEPEPDQPEDNPADREDNPAPQPPAEQPAHPVAPEQPAQPQAPEQPAPASQPAQPAQPAQPGNGNGNGNGGSSPEQVGGGQPEQSAPAPRPAPQPQPKPQPNEDEDPIFGNWRN